MKKDFKVELDVRTFYLIGLTLIGYTFQDDGVFPNLISYIEQDEIKPVVAQTFPLTDIVAAQEVFLSKIVYRQISFDPTARMRTEIRSN